MTGGRLEWVGPGAEVDEVVAKMKDHHIRRVPVLDIDRGLIGIISVGDLTARLRPGNAQMVEELEQVLSAPLNAEQREPS
jgi:CBS domain-containing protein